MHVVLSGLQRGLHATRWLACGLLFCALSGCDGSRQVGSSTAVPLFLNVASQDGALFLTWNTMPDARPVTLHWRRVGSDSWQSATGSAEGHYLVEGLENGAEYECYAERETQSGEKIASRPVVQTPRVRDFNIGLDVFASQPALDEWLRSKPIDPASLSFRGKPVTNWGPNIPDGGYTTADGGRTLMLLRYADQEFHRPAAPRPPAEVRAVLKHALWSTVNPFDNPEQFPMPITPIVPPLVGSVSRFASATSFAIAYHPQFTSRFTHFIPAAWAPDSAEPAQDGESSPAVSPEPASSPSPSPAAAQKRAWARRYAIYVHGHGGGTIRSGASTVDRLLEHGWQVIAMDMPLVGENGVDQVTTGMSHNGFFSWPSNGVSPVAVFLQPLKAVVDKIYADNRDKGEPTIVLIGKSGGGWTSYMYGALDDRIDYTVSIAGGMPMSQWGRVRPQIRRPDYEQVEPQIYGSVSYEDLMVTAGSRGAFYVYNEHDSCCFQLSPDDPFILYLRDASVMIDKPIGVYVDQETRTHSFSDAALAAVDDFIEKTETGRRGWFSGWWAK